MSDIRKNMAYMLSAAMMLGAPLQSYGSTLSLQEASGQEEERKEKTEEKAEKTEEKPVKDEDQQAGLEAGNGGSEEKPSEDDDTSDKEAGAETDTKDAPDGTDEKEDGAEENKGDAGEEADETGENPGGEEEKPAVGGETPDGTEEMPDESGKDTADSESRPEESGEPPGISESRPEESEEPPGVSESIPEESVEKPAATVESPDNKEEEPADSQEKPAAPPKAPERPDNSSDDAKDDSGAEQSPPAKEQPPETGASLEDGEDEKKEGEGEREEEETEEKEPETELVSMEDVFSVVLPTVPVSEDIYDYILDPQRLITATENAAHDGIDFERDATFFFRNHEGDEVYYSSRSDRMEVVNQGTVPVTVTLEVTAEEADGIRMLPEPEFDEDPSASVYLAITDGTEAMPAVSGETVSFKMRIEAARKDAYKIVYDEETETFVYQMTDKAKQAGYDGFAEKSFYMVGACNPDGNWRGISGDVPGVSVVWKIEPDEEAVSKTLVVTNGKVEGVIEDAESGDDLAFAKAQDDMDGEDGQWEVKPEKKVIGVLKTDEMK